MGKRLSAPQHGETVGLDDERLAIVLGHDVDLGTGHRRSEVAYHIDDGGFHVMARKKHYDGNARILKHAFYYYPHTVVLRFCMSRHVVDRYASRDVRDES